MLTSCLPQHHVMMTLIWCHPCGHLWATFCSCWITCVPFDMFYGLSVPSDCILHMKIKLLMNTFYKKSKPKCCRHKSRGTWGSGEPCRAVSDFNCTATWVNHNTFCCKNLVKCFFQTICFWSVKQCTSNHHQKILILDKLFSCIKTNPNALGSCCLHLPSSMVDF